MNERKISELFPPGFWPPSLPLSSPFSPLLAFYLFTFPRPHYRLSSLFSPSFFRPFPLFSSLHPSLCLRALEVDINECCDRLQQVISFLTLLTGDGSPRSSGWRDGGTAWRWRRDRESLPFSYFFVFLLFFIYFFCHPAAFLSPSLLHPGEQKPGGCQPGHTGFSHCIYTCCRRREEDEGGMMRRANIQHYWG